MSIPENNGNSSQIIAIGGGKGGTGKSFITTILGVDLARRNKKVVLLDIDLGGANLHSFLQIKRPQYSLSEFFDGKKPLGEIITPTEVPNLGLIVGDVRSISPDNIKYTQKLKLFRHIKNLDADYVILDLGAGSLLNVVDSFLLAERMMVVTVPERTAVENLYHFIKKVMIRKIELLLRIYEMRDFAMNSWKKRHGAEIKNIKEFIRFLKSLSYETRVIIENGLSKFAINIVLNQVRNAKHIEVGFSLKSVLIKYLGIEAKYLGYVEYNDYFWKYIGQSLPFLQITSSTPILNEISIISKNLRENSQISLSSIVNG